MFYATSVTRLGYFWKFLVTNYLSKVAQIFGDFRVMLKTSLFKYKLQWLPIWATLEKFGYISNPWSGHAVCHTSHKINLFFIIIIFVFPPAKATFTQSLTQSIGWPLGRPSEKRAKQASASFSVITFPSDLRLRQLQNKTGKEIERAKKIFSLPY